MTPKPNHYKLFAAACCVHARAKKSADIALAHERDGQLQAAATSYANAAMFTEVAVWLEAEAKRDELERSPEKRAEFEQKLLDTPLRRT